MYTARRSAWFTYPDFQGTLRNVGWSGSHSPPREREILQRLQGSETLREIAGDLFVPYNTVKTITSSVYRKFPVLTHGSELHHSPAGESNAHPNQSGTHPQHGHLQS